MDGEPRGRGEDPLSRAGGRSRAELEQPEPVRAGGERRADRAWGPGDAAVAHHALSPGDGAVAHRASGPGDAAVDETLATRPLTGADRVQLATTNLAHVLRFVELADRKAHFALTLALALLAGSMTILVPAAELTRRTLVLGGSWIALAVLVAGSYLAFLACLGRGLWQLVRAVRPRIEEGTERSSPFFFGTIARMEPAEFERLLEGLTYDDAADAFADQTHTNSRVAAAKYGSLDAGLLLVGKGVLFGVLYVVGLAIGQVVIR